MKILIISDAWKPQINGVVRTYEYLGEELEKMGHDVKVIGPSDFPIRFPMPGYSEIELTVLPYGRLKRLIESWLPDTIHIATEGPLGDAARKYCHKNLRSYTTSYHTQFPDYVAKRVAKAFPFCPAIARWSRNYTIRKMRKFHEKAMGIFIATASLEEELKSWGFKTPMYRLTRGVNLDMFKPESSDILSGAKKPIALYVGRVAIEKNLEDFLQMDWDGTRVIVGTGPSFDEFKAKYPDAIFAGKKTGTELAAYYKAADVFVFPSRTDTFGIVLIEALACGLPIAGYNVTGPKDIVTEDALGALEENDLAKATRRALQSSGTKQQRNNHVSQHYTWAKAAQQFMDIQSKAVRVN